jgi:hypothetical protein
MIEFVRAVHKHVEDLIVLDVEALCDLADQFKHHVSYPLCERKLDAVSDCIVEEASEGLVV